MTVNIRIGTQAFSFRMTYCGIYASQAGDPTEAEFIRIGDDTAFTFPYDTFIAGIQTGRLVLPPTPISCLLMTTESWGRSPSMKLESRPSSPKPFPNACQPQAIGPDPKQAMLNRRVEELQATVARQQKQIDALNAGLQKVSAQLEASKPAPKVVANK